MTKLGTGDDIPANALRNKKERDRYAVVTTTLKNLKTRLKLAHGNQTKVLEASLAELRRLKAEHLGKTHERDRLYQMLHLSIPPSSAPQLPLVPPNYSQQNQQAPVSMKEEYAQNCPQQMDRFNGDVKAPVPRYPAPVPSGFQQFSQPQAFFSSPMGYPPPAPDQWIQQPWMGQQFLQPNSIPHPNFPSIQQSTRPIEHPPSNIPAYSSPSTPAPEDTQILHDFLLGQLQ